MFRKGIFLGSLKFQIFIVVVFYLLSTECTIRDNCSNWLLLHALDLFVFDLHLWAKTIGRFKWYSIRMGNNLCWSSIRLYSGTTPF